MLYPHQVEAIRWMKTTEEQPRLHEMQPRGGILAHEMGLGKTVTMLTHMASTSGLNLVVCPKSVLTHWVKEAETRGCFHGPEVFLYYGSNRGSHLTPGTRLVVTTFDIARTESSHKKTSLLFTTLWERIVLDEAHRIAERNSKTSKSISQLRGFNRWCLTGTPYKNGLSDIVALCKFLKIQPYSKATWWKHNAHHELSLRQWRSLYLHIRYKSASFLAPLKVKHRALEPTEFEAQLQNSIRAIQVRGALESKGKLQEFELLKILRLRQAAVHPWLCLPDATVPLQNEFSGLRTSSSCCFKEQHTHPEETRECNMEHSLDLWDTDSMGLPMEDSVTTTSATTDTEATLPTLPTAATAVGTLIAPWTVTLGASSTTFHCSQHSLCLKCASTSLVCPVCVCAFPNANRYTDKEELVGVGVQEWKHSSKTLELLRIVQKHTLKSHKTVVFSQWTSCLDLIQKMFTFYGIAFCRFDGTVVTLEERTGIVEQFAKSDNTFVMLTSLGAGAEGINLTCASTVVLMEPYWNASIEKQAIDRVHRLGQTQKTRVYKLTLKHSVEDWILRLQQLKEQELEFYLKGTTPVAPQVQPDSTALGKRQQRLLEKTTGGASTSGSWKKNIKLTSPQNNMLSSFIY